MERGSERPSRASSVAHFQVVHRVEIIILGYPVERAALLCQPHDPERRYTLFIHMQVDLLALPGQFHETFKLGTGQNSLVSYQLGMHDSHRVVSSLAIVFAPSWLACATTL